MKRRIISIITALALCLSLCPTWAFAAEPDPALCPHHWEHTGECGYVAPTEGQPCGHQHTDECYAEETHCVHVHDETCYSDGQLPGEGEEKTADACTHECTADTGCVTRTLDCHHSHDSECGYVPADPGQPCGFVCRLCPIEDLIAALPDEVTADNAEEVRAWLDEILALFGALTGDEQELVDITPCLTLQEQLDAASAASPLADTITLNSRITINSGNLNQYNNKVITGATTKDHLTISGVTINLTIKDLSIQLPYSGDVNSGLVHAGIKLENNATLNLTLEGTNTIKGGSMNEAINVPAGCTLTISGSGSLTARGGDGSAGIGANFGRLSGIMTVGTININGGTIDAYGSSGGAGIGGTLRGSTGRVVINGGTVYAEGSGYSDKMGTALSAAGIGGGSMGKLESITITGGTVTARGHKVSDAGNTSASAGIGAGTDAYAYDGDVRDCGDITITGGTIDAKGGGDYAIGFGANSGSQTGSSIQVSGSPSINMNGGKMKPVPGDYILCELKVTIYDRSIVSDQSATLSYGCASWTGTLKKSNSEPYCGTLTASNLLVKGSGSPTLTVEAGGKTWTKEVSPQPNCSVIIGNQDYQKYSLTGTIYDGRITGAMTAASVTINGETHQVTLTRKDCQVSFSLPNLGAANASGAFPVTVTAGGITWTGTTSGGSNKTLTIGTRLQKVRLNFWDSAINRNISVQAQVSRRGSPLGASETVNDGTLHRTQNGNGYLEIWMVPGEDTTISVTVPGLNGGQAIEKTGLTIEARDMELDWYRGVSSDTPALDLSKGPITFDGSNGSLSVTYSDGTGKQHTQANLSYDALHVITQSDSAATGNYIVVKNLTQQLHIQVNGIHIKHWNSKLLTPIVVSQRGGKYYVVDGQHRIAAMRRMNGDKNVIVPCLMYTGLTYAQEAELYFNLEKSKGHLQLASEVKARLESGADPQALDIEQRIIDAGFTWALDNPTGAAYEIIPTRAILSAYKLLGGVGFSRMLELVAGAWHGKQSSLKTSIIAGLALFLKTYETEVNDLDFIKRLSSVDPFDITQLAKVDFTTDIRKLRFARVFRKKYNDHPGRKLPYRFKD